MLKCYDEKLGKWIYTEKGKYFTDKNQKQDVSRIN